MAQPLRALIVDDEWLIRSELQGMLQQYPEIEIVGEAANLAQAVHAVQTIKPDLVFLDIQMPGGTGFEVAEQIGDLCRFVFVTAFPEHLPAAQKYHAVDYLLKPVSKERLESAIRKLQNASQKEECL